MFPSSIEVSSNTSQTSTSPVFLAGPTSSCSSNNLNSSSTYDFMMMNEEEKGKIISIPKDQIVETTTLEDVAKLILPQAVPSHILDADNIRGCLKIHLAGFGIKYFTWNGIYHQTFENFGNENYIFRDYPFPSNSRIPIHLGIVEEKRYLTLIGGPISTFSSKRINTESFDMTVGKFKELIRTEIQIPQNKQYHCFTYQESNGVREKIELDNDDFLLSEYNLKHKSTIHMEEEKVNLISSSTNDRALFDSPIVYHTTISNCRVQDVKTELEKKRGYLAKYVTLFLDGNQLEDDSSLLSDYHVVHNSNIAVVLNLPPLPGQLFIKLDCNNNNNNNSLEEGNMITLDIDSSSVTIKSIFEMLRDTKNIELQKDSKNAILRAGDIYLEESNTLADYHLTHESVLSLSYDRYLITIKMLTGKSIPIDFDPLTMTPEVLKQKIQDKEGIPPSQQRLTFRGMLLDNGLLSDYGITVESTINLILSLRGGGGAFVDVSNEDAMEMHNWSSRAPDWRTVQPGLTLEGTCINKQCRAFREDVLSNHHFEMFDLCEKSSAIPRYYAKAKCPMCHNDITAIKPGFSNCYYRIEGMKSNSENGNESVAYLKEWTRVGDYYLTYDEAKAGIVQWDYLYIYTRPLDSVGFLAASMSKVALEEEEEEEASEQVIVPYNCPICFDKMGGPNGKGGKLSKCSNGHCFHHRCLTQWKMSCQSRQNNLSWGCPICRVDLSR